MIESAIRTAPAASWMVFLLLCGCGDSGDSGADEPGNGRETLDNASGPARAAYKIDGRGGDWDVSRRVSTEVGGAGGGSHGRLVDIKDLYVDADSLSLYLFFTSEPSLPERFEAHAESGIFAYVYADADGNRETGAADIDHSGNAGMLGTEVRIWMPLSVSVSSDGGSDQFLSAEVSRWDAATGRFGDSALRMASNSSEHLAISEEGIEMAIPLRDLGLGGRGEIDLVVIEWANNEDEKVLRVPVQLPGP